jgi:hypothetical protein
VKRGEARTGGASRRLSRVAAAWAVLVAIAAPGIAAERHAIAVFGDWGAFREPGAEGGTPSCFAVAQPPPGTRAASSGAFASVVSWPARRVRAQVSIRLSHISRPGAPVTLTIGDASFALTARDRSAWAHDRRQDAAIVVTMRSGSSMSIASVAPDGTPFADVYRLRGAATAIDAAMLACPI